MKLILPNWGGGRGCSPQAPRLLRFWCFRNVSKSTLGRAPLCKSKPYTNGMVPLFQRAGMRFFVFNMKEKRLNECLARPFKCVPATVKWRGVGKGKEVQKFFSPCPLGHALFLCRNFDYFYQFSTIFGCTSKSSPKR